MKLAFVFPGQGSQYVGMGKEIAATYPEAQTIFEEADRVLGFSLSNLCFEGPEADLVKTENTQPAILTTSVALLKVLEAQGLKPDMVAGHSLGEYSALVAGRSLEFTDAVKVVRQRGLLMQKAAPQGTAGMAAILGLSPEKVREVCEKASEFGVVEPANYNCPGQIVIAGELGALDKAMVMAKEAGAKRALPLNVSGPFHSSLMQPAADGLAQLFEEITVRNSEVPVVANVSAEIIKEASVIRDALIKQVSSSVRWEESVTNMIEQGVNTFVEVGPGKVLSGLIKKINKEVTLYHVEDVASLENLLANLKEVG